MFPRVEAMINGYKENRMEKKIYPLAGWTGERK